VREPQIRLKDETTNARPGAPVPSYTGSPPLWQHVSDGSAGTQSKVSLKERDGFNPPPWNTWRQLPKLTQTIYPFSAQVT